MKRITLAENKYTRALTILAYKEVLWGLDPEESQTLINLASDINSLMERELLLLDSELTAEERLKINPILFNNSAHPGYVLGEFAEQFEPERTNLLISDAAE